MRIVAFVGPSGSGKTRLVTRLIAEFSRRGLKTGVIKHCSHGFELDPEAKDSRRFWEAGAEGVALLSPRKWALLKRTPPEMRAAQAAAQLFADQDVVLVEGGKQEPGIRKIAVQRPGSGENISVEPDELAAVISEEELAGEKPVFHPDQIRLIADFILNEENT
jgi:molybdopterin-guanine dinucleotide biosynthesis protein B